ncbi:hypothetical protein TRVL_04436 [Trypanosoma vivax]|nr:hypothetical protein TRVL_04436 [Trypanosoma vivax]
MEESEQQQGVEDGEEELCGSQRTAQGQQKGRTLSQRGHCELYAGSSSRKGGPRNEGHVARAERTRKGRRRSAKGYGQEVQGRRSVKKGNKTEGTTEAWGEQHEVAGETTREQSRKQQERWLPLGARGH